MKQLLHDLKFFNITKQRISTKYRALADKYPDVVCQLINHTQFVPPGDHALYERLYCVLNDITEIPLCAHCNKPMVFSMGKRQYGTFHRACSQRDPSVRRKYTSSMVDKYGCVAPFQSAELRAKIEATNEQRYGSRYYTQTEQLKQLNRTNFNGTSHSSSRVAHAATFVDDEEWLRINTQLLTLDEIAQQLNVSQSLIQKRCMRFNITLPPRMVSSFERQVMEWLDDQCVEYEHQARVGGVSVDILIPAFNVALELDGLYWHGENSRTPRNRQYHVAKTEACLAANVRLVHITDYEWVVKQPIVTSRLLSLMKKAQRIYARKCVVVEVDVKTRSQFFNRTHIQGDVGCTVAYGLVHDGQLVACMSFGRPRFAKQYDWELLRLSSELNTSVIGGASRLLSWFIRTHAPTNIISYSDRRWSMGNVYSQLGFAHLHNSPPNYWYFRDQYLSDGIHSRVRFQKHKLPQLFHVLPDDPRSEWTIMKDNGYNRYWDCGNGVWLWESAVQLVRAEP